MSGYILCRTRMAEKPYYLESIGLNLYSVEELCYFLYHNVYLIDETLMDAPLFSWLEKELGLTELGKKLTALKGKYAAPLEFVFPIYKEINYLSYEELKILNARLTRLKGEPPLMRKKLRGDNLVENGIYAGALKTYQEIERERREGAPEPKKGFWGGVYHNMGCVYSYLFQQEEALSCFEKAYRQLHTRSSLKSYLCAYAEARTPIEYSSELAKLGVDAKLEQEVEEERSRAWEEARVPVYSRDVDGLIEELTREYHRSGSGLS